jgi:acetyltransferase, GNAT family
MGFYTVKEMTEDAAKYIASWKYPPPYDIYSFHDNSAEYEELQNGLHFAVFSDDFGEMPCGFLAIGWSAQIQDPELREIYDDETYTDIAFGLRPELCGCGYGSRFLKSVIDFTRTLFEEEGIRLTVDSENKRACRLYEKFGFHEIHAFRTCSIDAACGRTLSMKIMIL